jgi:hypothetical protein
MYDYEFVYQSGRWYLEVFQRYQYRIIHLEGKFCIMCGKELKK